MLDLRDTYPIQVIKNDSAYPYGKPKNKASESDKTGTPWEERLVRDLVGWMQALVDDQSIEPNGTTERKGASQILTALQTLAAEIAHQEFDADSAVVAARTGVCSVPLIIQCNSDDRFVAQAVAPDSIATVLVQLSIVNAGLITIPVPPPYRELAIAANGISVYVQGNTGHSGLPATMPYVGVGVYNGTSDTATLLGEDDDDSASVGAYEAIHLIKPTFAARNIAANEVVGVTVKGETGTNAIVGLAVRAVLATWTTQS